MNSSVIRDRKGLAVRSIAENVTEPPGAVGETILVLPVQIARFGDLACRDLSARALAAREQRYGDDPRNRGDAGDCQPLSQAEQREMRALRAALMLGYQPAVPFGVPGSRQNLLRLARLRRPSPLPGPRRAPARHRRAAITDPTS